MILGNDGGASAATIGDIAALLLSGRKIAVLPHNTADGDTLGCGIAACLALRKLGKEVSLIHEEAFPDNLSDLFGCYDFLKFLPDDESLFDERWDAIAIFDTADPKLLGRRERLFGRTDCLINVDHHISNLNFGKYNLIDPGASSTADIVYRLIKEMGAQFDRDIALAIYTGVCTDTGGFSYSNTTSASHEIAAWALQYDIDVAYLRYKFFDAITHGKLQCHGYVANQLKLHNNGRYAVVVVSASALAEIGAEEADCEGLVNIGRNIVGVEVSVFARETGPGEFRVNLRSRGDFDVAAVARKFGGGGHKRAAGCTVLAPSDQVEQILLAALEDK